ncbi:hypothetical protein MAPG_09159 [Magnaporthiopsis poae ATCC 64411]|uniref:Uncharacterized protein n=1 Tax=Magnaporthiopsis poae (strain ATCC 64411 / 73-15) TaxID=644358 RepID=A0A0C4E980_MAGP6|nr:hypothetical protein MAPG_09159 [Magnaporthiopsis poae ATCC 64411]
MARRPGTDPAAARRQQYHHPVVRVLLLVVALFASLAVSAEKRPGEHVVLADCHAGNNVYSSQIAYFNGPPNDKPQDVAPVVTPANQTRLWPANTTTGFFSTTGTSFTAQLGPPVDLGGFAGTGFNDYANFTCWRRYQANLYKYDGAICAMSYDCTHEPMPNGTKADPDPKGPQAPKSPDGTSAPSAPGSNRNSDGGPPEELSLGAMIGVIVGGVVGLAMLAGLIAFVIIQRRRWRRQREELDREMEAILLGTPKLAQTTMGGEGTEKKGFDNSSSPPPPPSASPGPRHEVDGHWRGAEVHGAGVVTELDGVYIVPELDARGKQTPVTAAEGTDGPAVVG